MNEEFEVKFLNINRKALENKLIALKAKKVLDSLFIIRIFDYPDLRLHKKRRLGEGKRRRKQVCNDL